MDEFNKTSNVQYWDITNNGTSYSKKQSILDESEKLSKEKQLLNDLKYTKKELFWASGGNEW